MDPRPAMKRCPFCAEEIREEAIKCRWCGMMLDGSNATWVAGPPGPSAWPPSPPAEEAQQYTHSGQRYLLGYGATSFGIWDRQGSDVPIDRFPRTAAGWEAAQARFSELEPHAVEVGLGPPGLLAPAASGPPPGGPGGGYGSLGPPRGWTPRARPTVVHPAWWLAPILAGWLGGLIAWLVNRDVDARVARNMLITGIVISVVSVVLIFGVFGGQSGLGRL